MDSLLFLAHRIPYPPNKGDKIRSFHLLRYLSKRFRVHLGAFVDDPDDQRYAGEVGRLCAELCLVPLDALRARLRSLPGLLRREALSLPYYRDARMQGWVDGLIGKGAVDRALVFSSTMAQYLEGRPALPAPVVDFVDVDSDKWRQYADSRAWPLSWLYRRESRLLLAYERRVAAEASAAVFVSEQEAELFRGLAPDAADRVAAVANGVDTDYFSPERTYPDPYPAGTRALVFTGVMDYWANVDAVSWFAAEVFPALRRAAGDARFYIVGSRPVAEVKALERIEGVTVTGAVPDVRPYLAHAAVSVAPLRIARGVQNKVLEAMAMGCAVLASAEAAEGIAAVPGQDFVVARGAKEMIAQGLRLLGGDRAGLAQAARARVLESYHWDDKLARFAGLLAP